MRVVIKDSSADCSSWTAGYIAYRINWAFTKS